MKKYVLGRTKTLALLDYQAGSSGDKDATLYIPPRSSPIEILVRLPKFPMN
jgi:hypothetical protein